MLNDIFIGDLYLYATLRKVTETEMHKKILLCNFVLRKFLKDIAPSMHDISISRLRKERKEYEQYFVT